MLETDRWPVDSVPQPKYFWMITAAEQKSKTFTWSRSLKFGFRLHSPSCGASELTNLFSVCVHNYPRLQGRRKGALDPLGFEILKMIFS